MIRREPKDDEPADLSIRREPQREGRICKLGEFSRRDL